MYKLLPLLALIGCTDFEAMKRGIDAKGHDQSYPSLNDVKDRPKVCPCKERARKAALAKLQEDRKKAQTLQERERKNPQNRH
jgi:hypothetical protein